MHLVLVLTAITVGVSSTPVKDRGRRCRIPEFVALARTITRLLPLIHNTLDHHLGNALSEATNTHLRLLTRRAYGYHSPEALIAMATSPAAASAHPSPADHENRPTETAVGPKVAASDYSDYGTLPRSTTHSADCPVTLAILSKSES